MSDRFTLVPGVDRQVAVQQIRQLKTDFDEMDVSIVRSSRELRPHFLKVAHKAELALGRLLAEDDFLLGLQTPRYLSLLNRQVADDQLRPTVIAERQRWLRALSELQAAIKQPSTAQKQASLLPEAGNNEVAVRVPPVRNRNVPAAPIPPKAFISHASADKERFVLALASSLRTQGIDAWLDRWEMRPGDSLPKEIFDGGIDDCDVFMIVLSKHSVTSKWVREELDAGVVRAIEGRCRLIPVVLDNVEVPPSLQHRIWVTIDDPSNYEAKLDEIVRTIYNFSPRPGLGPRPAYAEPSIAIPGMSPTDSIILGLAAEQAIGSGSVFLDMPGVQESAKKLAISDDAFMETMESLGRLHLLDVTLGYGGRVSHASITWHGLETYVTATKPDFGVTQQAVFTALLNAGGPPPPLDVSDIATATEAPRMIVELVLEGLKEQDLISMQRYMGNAVKVHRVSSLLARLVN